MVYIVFQQSSCIRVSPKLSIKSGSGVSANSKSNMSGFWNIDCYLLVSYGSLIGDHPCFLTFYNYDPY